MTVVQHGSRSRTVAFIGVLLAALLQGCGADDASPETSTTGHEVAASPRDAKQAAKSTVIRYVRRLGDVMRDPDTPISALRDVALGDLLKADLYVYGGTRDFGTFEHGGRAKMRNLRVVRVDLDNTESSTAGGYPYVVVEACRDTTKVQSFNKLGKKPVTPYPAGKYLQRHVVVLTDDGWRVYARRDLRPTEGCGA